MAKIEKFMLWTWVDSISYKTQALFGVKVAIHNGSSNTYNINLTEIMILTDPFIKHTL